MDLAFVLDSSDTIHEALKGAKELVKDMVRGLKLGPDDSRVSLVLFADKVEVKARFRHNYGVKKFQDIVQSVISIGSRTRIDKALLKTKEVFQEGRNDAYKIAVVLTDGKQSLEHDTKSLLTTSKPLRSSGVRVIAVGIGAEASEGKLRLMTDSMQDVKMKDKALKYFQEQIDILQKNRCAPSSRKNPEQEVREDYSNGCGKRANRDEDFCNTDSAGELCALTCNLYDLKSLERPKDTIY